MGIQEDKEWFDKNTKQSIEHQWKEQINNK